VSLTIKPFPKQPTNNLNSIVLFSCSLVNRSGHVSSHISWRIKKKLCSLCLTPPLPLLPYRCKGAAPGGGGAGAPGAGSGRAEEAVSGPDGDSGEAEGGQGRSPGGR